MIIDFDTKTATECYFLMASAIIPRPIAWVMTKGEVLNLAPFSYFTPISSTPPTMIISIGHKEDGSPKDTLRNLRETKRCVVSIVDEEHLKPMHFSSKNIPKDQSEIDVFNIPTTTLFDEFPPMPKGVKISLFGEYLQEVDLKGSSTVPVIIQIKYLFIDDAIITDREKVTFHLNSIARVGRGYVKLGEVLSPPKVP